MCPACIPNLAVALVGFTSISGITALVMTRARNEDALPDETITSQEQTKQENQDV
jgi:hypothetical protein